MRNNGAANVNNTDNEAIESLATLPPLEYERQRELQAVKLRCRVGKLDKLVEMRRANTNGALQGSAVVLPNIELWTESVDGAQTLEDIAEAFRRYVALP